MNTSIFPFSAFGYASAISVVLFVVVVLVLVLLIISRISGWRELAEHYPDQNLGSQANKKYFVYARLKRFVNYNGILVLESTSTGLRVRMLKLFSLGHPAFFIPWSDISFVEAKKGITFRAGIKLVRTNDVAMYVPTNVRAWIEGEQKKYNV